MTARRGRPPLALTRDDVLDAAVEVFAAQPYEQVSVLDIARRAGVGRSWLHQHHGGKAELHRAAVEHAARRFGRLLSERTAQLRPASADPAALEAVLRALLEALDAEPAVSRLVLAPGTERRTGAPQGLRQLLLAAVDDELAGMLAGTADPAAAVSLVSGAVEHLFRRAANDPHHDRASLAQAGAAFIAAGLAALGSAPSAPRP